MVPFPANPRLLALVALLAAGCDVVVSEFPEPDGAISTGSEDGSTASEPTDAAPAHDAGAILEDDGGPVAEPDASAAAAHDASAAAGPDAAMRPDSGAGCGAYSGATQFTCTSDGNARVKCSAGVLTTEACSRGCLRVSSADDVCMGTKDDWSCTGSWGTTKDQSGDYYLTGFGCWTDSGGSVHTDSGDNCIPGCFSKAQSAGICHSGETGPKCEERVNWYAADSGRFGCLSRIRITNPKNGKAVIAIVLDAGPGCSVEQKASKGVLDASDRIDVQLFGSGQGWSDKALVHVVEVDSSTPLGPVP